MTKLRTRDLVKNAKYLMFGTQVVTFIALTQQQATPGRYYPCPLVLLPDGRQGLISVRHLRRLPDTEEK